MACYLNNTIKKIPTEFSQQQLKKLRSDPSQSEIVLKCFTFTKSIFQDST